MTQDAARTQLSLCGDNPFRTTDAQVSDARLIPVPDSNVLLVLWNEQVGGGELFPYYAISMDGREIETVRRTSYDLKLKYARFDPVTQNVTVDPRLSADPGNRLYVVQFVTHPLGALRGTVKSTCPVR